MEGWQGELTFLPGGAQIDERWLPPLRGVGDLHPLVCPSPHPSLGMPSTEGTQGVLGHRLLILLHSFSSARPLWVFEILIQRQWELGSLVLCPDRPTESFLP